MERDMQWILSVNSLLIDSKDYQFLEAGMYCIYKLTSPSGKISIGKASHFEARMRKHEQNALRGRRSRLYTAIKKYGWNNFTKEIIEITDKENLSSREVFWIDFYQSFSDPSKGYNMTPGGDGGDTLIDWTDEEKRILWAEQAQKRVGQHRSEEWKQNFKEVARKREANKTESQKQAKSKKISETNKRSGHKPPYHPEGTKGFRGHKHSASAREKISKARLGKSYEDIVGIEQAEIMKKMRHEAWLGKNNPQYKKVDLDILAQAVVINPELTAKQAGEIFQVSSVTIFNKLDMPWTKWKQEVLDERNKKEIGDNSKN
jgi:group I intron endonuclease